MAGMKINAYAKLNFTLDIMGKRPDGYHELSMVMQSISLHDELEITKRTDGRIVLSCDAQYLPSDNSNLAVKAVNAFFEDTGFMNPGFDISIKKNIPVCAGMAGGSADGAAVLRAMRYLYFPDMSIYELCKIGEKVGSDVPYCLFGGSALAEGRGEKLTRLPEMVGCHVVVCKPDFPVSTPELFALSDDNKLKCHPDTKGMIDCLTAKDFDGIAHRLYNVFEDILPKKYNEVKTIKSKMLDLGALNACMTGSGPTVFGLFREEKTANYAYQQLSQSYGQTFLTQTL